MEAGLVMHARYSAFSCRKSTFTSAEILEVRQVHRCKFSYTMRHGVLDSGQ